MNLIQQGVAPSPFFPQSIEKVGLRFGLAVQTMQSKGLSAKVFKLLELELLVRHAQTFSTLLIIAGPEYLLLHFIAFRMNKLEENYLTRVFAGVSGVCGSSR